MFDGCSLHASVYVLLFRPRSRAGRHEGYAGREIAAAGVRFLRTRPPAQGALRDVPMKTRVASSLARRSLRLPSLTHAATHRTSPRRACVRRGPSVMSL
jgi:hypothetical protein